MYTIPQRLNKIFSILLENNEPVSVAKLAFLLGVSRRTVFRELENVDSILKKLNLRLETTVGEGLYLFGKKEDINKLSEIINIQRESIATDKTSRRNALVLLILDSAQWKKLYYFSSVLEVSEATISLDMDVIEHELKTYNIQLLRKKGLGVFVNATEMNIRTAFVNYLLKVQNTTLPQNILSASIVQGVNDIIKVQSIFLNWMTKDALAILSYRLIAQVSRLKSGQILGPSEVKKQNTLYTEVAIKLAQDLCTNFDIEIAEQELDYIVDGLRAARTLTKSEFYEDDSITFGRAKNIAFKMIERFDSRLAPTLITNEELVRGLSIHLWSAIVRIENGYRIKDPLGGQLKEEYPDIFRNAQQACSVLVEELQKPVPEEEVSCVATHFGAAVMLLGEKRIKRRLKVGIICLGGIGVSYMMAGQVKKYFSKELITEVGEYNQPYSWKNCDFLIATADIPNANKPVVIAQPLLSSSNISEISKLIEKLSINTQVQDKVVNQNNNVFSEKLSNVITHLQNIEYLLQNFKKMDIQPEMKIDELSKFVSYRFFDSPSDGEKIYNNLMARENISSQLIEQLELVLLHCSCDSVKQPMIALLHPNEGYIFNEQGQKAKSCFLMLIPNNSCTELKQAMGAVSSALVEDDYFLKAVLNGDENTVYAKLEQIFSVQLSDYYSDMLGE